MIDWTNPSDDVVEARRIGHEDAMSDADEIREAMKDRLLEQIDILQPVVNSALAYKASLLQTISSRPKEEQETMMQGRMVLRQEFIQACERYEALQSSRTGS